MRSETAVRDAHKQLRAKESTDERSRRSEPVWWAWLDLNQRPHPYQQNAGNRCANRHSCRSASTVEAEVTKGYGSSWIFEPHLTCTNVVP